MDIKKSNESDNEIMKEIDIDNQKDRGIKYKRKWKSDNIIKKDERKRGREREEKGKNRKVKCVCVIA